MTSPGEVLENERDQEHHNYSSEMSSISRVSIPGGQRGSANSDEGDDDDDDDDESEEDEAQQQSPQQPQPTPPPYPPPTHAAQPLFQPRPPPPRQKPPALTDANNSSATIATSPTSSSSSSSSSVVDWSGAVPSLLRTSFALPDGTVLFVDGSVRSKEGNITNSSDPLLEDALQYLDCSQDLLGAIKFLDGCFLLRDGTILLPSHSIVISSNSILRWDGKILTPKWRIALGSRPLPTGAIFSPAGTVQYADGTSKQCVNKIRGSRGNRNNSSDGVNGSNNNDKDSSVSSTSSQKHSAEVKSDQKGAFSDGCYYDESNSLVFPSGAKVTSSTWVRLATGQQRAALWHLPTNKITTRFELPEITLGSDMNDPVFDLRSFDLMSAAQSCDARMVERFLRGGVGDPNEKDANGNTPLHLTWSLPCMQYLIQFGGSSDTLNAAGQQPTTKFVFAQRQALQAFELKLQGNELEKDLHEIMLTINIHCKDFPKQKKGDSLAVIVSGKAPGEGEYLHVAETELVRHKGDVTFRQDVVMEYRPGVSLRFEAFSCPVDVKRFQKELCKLIGVGEIDSEQLLQASKANKFNFVQVRNPNDSALNKALQVQSASIRLRATHTEESMEEASAVESSWIEATLFCTDAKGVPGFVVAVSTADEESSSSSSSTSSSGGVGGVNNGGVSPGKRFKYLGRTEYIAADQLSQSARFTHKVVFQHRVPEDNHRVLRFGLYSDPSIATTHLIGQAVVSMTHLLSNNQVEADNNTFPLLTRQNVESGARLGVVLQVVTESARTKRYLPPDLEFNLKCIMHSGKEPKGKWIVEAWSRNNENDKEYVGSVGALAVDNSRNLEFAHTLCVKNVDLAQSLQLCLRRDIDENETSSNGNSSNVKDKEVEEVYECDVILADVRMLQFSPKVVTFKFPFALADPSSEMLTRMNSGTNCGSVRSSGCVSSPSSRSSTNSVVGRSSKVDSGGMMCLTAQMCGTLEVAVACTKLPRIHGPFTNTKCNPFVAVYWKGKKLSQTELVRNEPNPFFKRRLRLPLTSEQMGTDLEFIVHYVTETAGRSPLVENMGSVKLSNLRAIIAHEYDPFFSYQISTKTKTEEAPTLDLRAMFVTASSEESKEGSKITDRVPQMTGWLNKTRRGGLTKNWRKRYFVLQDSVLKYYENESMTEVLGYFSVNQATVRRYEDLFGSPNAFSVALLDQTRMYYLQASVSPERDLWIMCLARHGALTSRQADVHAQINERASIGSGGASLPRTVSEFTLHASDPPSPSVGPVSSTAGYLGKTRRGGLLKHWKKRYFILDAGVMSYFQDRESSNGQALGSFPVKGVALQKHGELFGSPLTFSIASSGGRTYYLQAGTAKERETWIQCLLVNGAISEEPQSPRNVPLTPRPSMMNTSPTKD